MTVIRINTNWSQGKVDKMSDIILNIIFAIMAVGFAFYSYKKDKKRNAIGFLVVGALVCVYTYKIWSMGN